MTNDSKKLEGRLLEAQRLKQHVGVESILLAPITDKDSTVIRALHRADITSVKLRAALESNIRHGAAQLIRLGYHLGPKKYLSLLWIRLTRLVLRSADPNTCY